MQTIPIQDLEQQAKEKGCPLYVIIDEMILEYFKTKEPVKVEKK